MTEETLDLELTMGPNGKDRDRPAITVVARVCDELVVKTDADRSDRAEFIVAFEYLFVTRVRQLSVADENAEAASVQELLVDP